MGLHGTKNYENIINTAAGRKKASLVLNNCRVFNVFTNELEEAEVAIEDGYIVGVGNYEGVREIDLEGDIVCPGLIDGHIHIESTMMSPSEFASAVVPHGTTAVITDPHEIANVAGKDGIRYMMERSLGLPLDIFFMLPSCVPATPLDESGAVLEAKDLSEFYEDPRVLGLAEMMNSYGTVRSDKGILDKISDAVNAGRVVDGHAPGLSGRELNAYIAAGVASDHECSASAEAIEKLCRGQWIMIREGTAANNLKALLPLFGGKYYSRCMLVTDDKHPGDLDSFGHIDYIIRKAVRLGVNPLHAVRMATFNPASYFGLKDMGAVAPGYRADLVVVPSLDDFRIKRVYKGGVLVAENGRLTGNYKNTADRAVSPETIETKYGRVYNSFNLKELSKEDFAIKDKGSYKRVIGLQKGELLTTELIVPFMTESADDPGIGTDGETSAKTFTGAETAYGVETSRDIIKLAVIERHKNTGHIGLGYIHGYGLKEGAVASSIAHDSHNLIVAGTNDTDMALAANTVRKNGGGLAVVADGKVLGELALPIGGLMCDESAEKIEQKLTYLKDVARQLGVKSGIDPFMTLGFVSLPVIPALRLTTGGLVDVLSQQIVPVIF